MFAFLTTAQKIKLLDESLGSMKKIRGYKLTVRHRRRRLRKILMISSLLESDDEHDSYVNFIFKFIKITNWPILPEYLIELRQSDTSDTIDSWSMIKKHVDQLKLTRV